MLQTIHKYIKGWVAGVIGFLVCAGFILMGLQYYIASSSQKSKAAAIVGGVEISSQQVVSAYNRLANPLIAAGKPLAIVQQKRLKALALNQLINQVALSHALKKTGFSANPATVTSFILSMKAFHVNGQFSPQRFQQLMYANGLTPQSFRQHVAMRMLNAQLQDGLALSAFTLPREVTEAYQLSDQMRDFAYVVLKPQKLADEMVAKSSLEAYYKAHQKAYTVPTHVQLAYLELSPKHIQVHVTVAEAKDYYQVNSMNYRTPVTWLVNQVLVKAPQGSSARVMIKAKTHVQQLVKQLESGVAFAHVAKITQLKVTEATASSKAMVLLAAMQPGQISVPFQTKAGFVIWQLVKKEAGKLKPFSQVESRILRSLKVQKLQQIFNQQTNVLSNLTYTNPTSLAIAAKALKLKIHKTEFFARSGTKRGIAKYPAVVNAAFSNDVLVQRNNSNLITLKNGTALIVRAINVRVTHVKPLKVVEAQVLKAVRMHQGSVAAKVAADNIQRGLAEGRSFAVLAKKYRVVLHHEKGKTRHNLFVEKPIVQAAFHLTKKGDATVVSLKVGAYAVVQLGNVVPASLKNFSTLQQRVIAGRLVHYQGQLDYQAFVNGARQRADVKIPKEG